jgi:hypothetical protein
MRVFFLIGLCALASVAIACTGGTSDHEKLPDPDTISPEECPTTCKNIPPAGICIGEWAVKCGDEQGVCTDCASAGQKCVHNPLLSTTSCKDLEFEVPACLPKCTDKTCGDDECGGSCGFCPSSGICDGTQCHLPGDVCGDIPSTGACLGNAVATCVNDGLQYLDCTPLLRKCAYNPATSKFECMLP